jgi:hypothetical protein
MTDKIKNILHQKPYLPGLLLVLFLIIIYLPSLDIYLRGDDFEWLTSSYPGLTNPSQLLRTINHFFRPLVKVSYLLDYILFGQNIIFYNLTTLLFHLVNVFLFYWLLYRFYKRIGPAIVIALCFGASAMYSEVTLWSAGRPDSILLMFMLAVMLRLNRLEPGRVLNWRQHLAVFLFALLAVGSKETWILLPPLVFIFLWIGKEHRLMNTIKNTLPLFLLLAVYLGIFILMPILSGQKSPTAYAGIGFSTAVLKLGFLLFKYVGLSTSFTGAWWQYALIFLLLIILSVRFLQTRNRIAFTGLLWMCITIAISLPIQYAPSRYNYLPLLGFWIMVVAFLDFELKNLTNRFKIKRGFLAAVTGLALLFYISHQSIMLQWEIKDYHRWGSTHKQVVDMYKQVRNQINRDKPLLFINLGTRKAVHETTRAIQGYGKLLFVREKALWQQMHLSTLDNFLGSPFKETLEPIPAKKVEQVLNGECTTLVFTDNGFFISDAHLPKVREFYQQKGSLPFRVEALQWLKR